MSVAVEATFRLTSALSSYVTAFGVSVSVTVSLLSTVPFPLTSFHTAVYVFVESLQVLLVASGVSATVVSVSFT